MKFEKSKSFFNRGNNKVSRHWGSIGGNRPLAGTEKSCIASRIYDQYSHHGCIDDWDKGGYHTIQNSCIFGVTSFIFEGTK